MEQVLLNGGSLTRPGSHTRSLHRGTQVAHKDSLSLPRRRVTIIEASRSICFLSSSHLPHLATTQTFFLLSKVTRHQVRLERSTVRPAPVSSLQVPSQMSTSLPHYRVDHWSKIPAPRNPAAALRILQTGGIQRIRNQSENNLMARERERERERERKRARWEGEGRK